MGGGRRPRLRFVSDGNVLAQRHIGTYEVMQMLNAIRSGKWALVALMATGLLGLPEAAEARDRCDRNGRNDRSGRYSSQQRYSGYRNDGYYRNDSSYRNDGYYRNNNNGYYRDSGYYGDDYRYEQPRSAGKSAAIIGGGAAAGAAVGAMTGGKKGALIGAAVGGIGGLVYDRSTRNRRSGW